MIDYCGDGTMAGMWLMGLLWLLVVGGGIGLVAWAIFRRPSGDRPGGQRNQDAALTALRQRFATGEIDETEYRARREVLETNGAESISQG